jgi:hypothetical protein
MYRSAIYAELYLGASSGNDTSKSAPLMSQSLMTVYVHVLTYFMAAWKFLKQHQWREISRFSEIFDVKMTNKHLT